MSCAEREYQPGTILVVDDEPAVLEVLAQALETVGGYKVLCARDGRSALEQLKGSRVDLVLTDLHMPHMDGLQLIRHLVKDRWTIPIIAMSGDARHDEASHRPLAAPVGRIRYRASRPAQGLGAIPGCPCTTR